MPRVKSPHTSSHRAQVWLFMLTRRRLPVSVSLTDFPVSKTKGRLFHNTNGSRVEDDEQQWPILHERTGGNLVNAGASPPALGASGKMSDEWTGTLNLNGACVPARAKATEAVQNPYAHISCAVWNLCLHPCRKLTTWPKDLQLDLANGPDISTLDIQTWIYETKAPVVLLRCIDGTTDDWQFDQLVEELRNSGSVSRSDFLFSPSHFYSTQL